jgi:hypothetical protein
MLKQMAHKVTALLQSISQHGFVGAHEKGVKSEIVKMSYLLAR